MSETSDTTSLSDYVQSTAKLIDSIRVQVSLPSNTPDQKKHFAVLLDPYVTLVGRYVAEIVAVASNSAERPVATTDSADVDASIATLAGYLVQLQHATATPQALSPAQTATIRSVLHLLGAITLSLEQELHDAIHVDSAMHGEGPHP
jgi:hypothetical protein